MNRANFVVDTEKCVGCGKCVKVCPGGILSLNQAKKAEIADFKEFGWNGCWKCEHCLAVCPTGAISIFGHKPEDSLPVPDYKVAAPTMNSLVANRHSCRRYQDRNVDATIISDMEQLGLAIDDTVTVTVPGGSSREYRITGVLTDMGSLLKADVYGMVLTEDGFRQIADENAKDGTTFRVQFKDGVNIQAAIREIKAQYGLSDSQVSENTALLGLMGQSKNSTMQSLYIVAGFLVLLVLIAGAVMIAASFNTNVLERVQFYGLLRCLGASKAQVKHFVILQGLRQSIKGVPIGLVAGQIITWCACLLLKSISGERFSEIPLFQFSVSGLIAGAVIGFLIVLLASLSPAKKASKVSPVTAISGSSQLTQNKRAANTKLFHIETSMGIFHALSGKKNVFLMTCSFAISIMMFLSFQV